MNRSVLYFFIFLVFLAFGYFFVGVSITGDAIVSFSIAEKSEIFSNISFTSNDSMNLDAEFVEMEIVLEDNIEGSVYVLYFSESPVFETEGLCDFSTNFIEIRADEAIINSLNSLVLTIPYDKNYWSALGLESNLVGYYFNETSKEWEDVPVTLNLNLGTLSMQIDYVGLFSIGACTQEGNETSIISSGGGSSYKTNLTQDDQDIDEVYDLEPKELFDITFNLEDRTIVHSSELIGIITFESFGNVPTLVDLTFIILDEGGNEMYRKVGEITVTTEEVLRWNYEGLELGHGKYVAVLETLYNVDVKDEFRQEFEIKEERGMNWRWIIGGAIVVIIILIIIFVVKKKKWMKRKIKVGER